MTHSRSSPCASQGSSSVKWVTHWRQVQGMRVMSVPQKKRFGPKALTPTHYHEMNWSTQKWTRGCFTGFLAPGATVLFGAAVRDSVGPLHWAGTETATDWPSFIDGAVRSGQREADAILRART